MPRQTGSSRKAEDGGSARTEDANGYVEVAANPITKVGVFPYMGRSLGGEAAGLDPEKVYMVYRPEEELNNPETLSSLRLLPIVDEHAMLGEMGMPAEQKGIHGVTGEDIVFRDGYVLANLKLHSLALKTAIEGGKKELSLGFGCRYEFAPGVFNGQNYDAIQREIRGNHLALVKEGRMGPEVRVLDEMETTSKGADMDENEEKKAGDQEEAITLEGVAAQVKELTAVVGALKEFVEKLKPLEKEEHGSALDEEKKAEDEDDDKKEKASVAVDEAEITRRVMQRMEQKAKLYDKVSKHVGTFATDGMDAKAVALYAAERMSIPVTDGMEIGQVEAYILGLDKGTAAKPANVAGMAMDHKSDEIDSYLQGGKK